MSGPVASALVTAGLEAVAMTALLLSPLGAELLAVIFDEPIPTKPRRRRHHRLLLTRPDPTTPSQAHHLPDLWRARPRPGDRRRQPRTGRRP